MDLDPEELRQILNQSWAELYEEATIAPLPIGFPPEVLTKLEKIFGTYPGWDSIDAASERIRSEASSCPAYQFQEILTILRISRFCCV